MPYIMTIVSLFAGDGFFKYLIEKSENADRKFNRDNKIVIKKYHNKGAMLNIGDKNQHFVALLSLVFSAFVTGMFVVTLGMKGKGLLNAGLALILGGAYSNTYDRLKRKYVVDYFSFHIDTKKYRSRIWKSLAVRLNTIVFNLSDFGIIIGAMLLVISELGTK
ncbi:MAG: signal peptidase II [Lachnospiraceae bacterium]|nr:signal peptidase II [Lachnospiraceae bacterium]